MGNKPGGLRCFFRVAAFAGSGKAPAKHAPPTTAMALFGTCSNQISWKPARGSRCQARSFVSECCFSPADGRLFIFHYISCLYIGSSGRAYRLLLQERQVGKMIHSSPLPDLDIPKVSELPLMLNTTHAIVSAMSSTTSIRRIRQSVTSRSGTMPPTSISMSRPRRCCRG